MAPRFFLSFTLPTRLGLSEAVGAIERARKAAEEAEEAERIRSLAHLAHRLQARPAARRRRESYTRVGRISGGDRSVGLRLGGDGWGRVPGFEHCLRGGLELVVGASRSQGPADPRCSAGHGGTLPLGAGICIL